MYDIVLPRAQYHHSEHKEVAGDNVKARILAFTLDKHLGYPPSHKARLRVGMPLASVGMLV